MSLKANIISQQKEAMKAGEKERVQVLRNLHAAIKQVEIDTRTDLTDEEVMQVVQRQVKQLQDALKDFKAGGREDLVAQNESEIQLLSTFLPEQLSDEDIATIIREVLDTAGEAAQFGQIMGMVMKAVAGKADGNRVRTLLETSMK